MPKRGLFTLPLPWVCFMLRRAVTSRHLITGVSPSPTSQVSPDVADVGIGQTASVSPDSTRRTTSEEVNRVGPRKVNKNYLRYVSITLSFPAQIEVKFQFWI